MLKLAITATVAIAVLFSANNVVALTHNRLNNLSKSTVDSRQSKSNAPQSEIKGINQAISDYFKEKNNKELSNCQTGGACFFFEIKSLKLVSLSDDSAEILAKVESQNYRSGRSGSNSLQWSYEKGTIFMPAKNEHMIMLKKINQKWKVSVSVI